MSRNAKNIASIEEAFQLLADLINDMSPEDRIKMRDQLASYTHDLKNTIGLITGANTLITKSSDSSEFNTGTLEMTELITTAITQLDKQIMIMVENLNNQIEDQIIG